MIVQLLSFTGDQPETVGRAWLEGDRVHFSDVFTKELCIDVAADDAGPVPVEDAARFLRSLPRCLTGSALRAEIL